MRNLNNKDLFSIMRIMGKANVKDKLLNMKAPEDLEDKEYGIMLILEIIESAPSAESEIFAFLADVGGVEQEELENDEFEMLPNIIEHLMNQKNLTSFLKQAFKSAK